MIRALWCIPTHQPTNPPTHPPTHPPPPSPQPPHLYIRMWFLCTFQLPTNQEPERTQSISFTELKKQRRNLGFFGSIQKEPTANQQTASFLTLNATFVLSSTIYDYVSGIRIYANSDEIQKTLVPYSVSDPHWSVQLFTSMWIRIKGANQCGSMRI